MKLLNTYTYVAKKSKFIAYYYEVSSKEEVLSILDNIKKENKKARHIPYAYIIDNTAKKSEDGEPANTAGSVIYNVMDRENLKNKLILVVRYFGGIKLGVGGLRRAYHKVCEEVIKFA